MGVDFGILRMPATPGPSTDRGGRQISATLHLLAVTKRISTSQYFGAAALSSRAAKSTKVVLRDAAYTLQIYTAHH